MARKPYFSPAPDDPPPLRATVTRRVRFEEVDPLGIVWHGRYPSYFDDARVVLSDRYGMGYMDFLDQQLVTPIRQLHVDHFQPLSYPEEFKIEAALHYTEAARINYEFTIRNARNELLASGYTVQLILDMKREVLVVAPPFLAAIRESWRRQGTLEPVTRPDEMPTRLVERFSELQ